MTSTATETATCGTLFSTPKRGEKACTKTAGHEGKHSSTVRKEYVPVDMKDLATFRVVTNEKEISDKLAPKRAPGVKAAERSDTLKELDKQNEELYQGWVTAGKPDEFTRPVGKVHVPPEKVESIKFLIRKSAEFIGHGCRFGDDGVSDSQGRTVVSWQVRDKRPHTPSNGS